MKKILTIVGARPQIIKSSAINRAINDFYSSQLEEKIIHTGQHYDENMSAVFFDEMQIPQPHYNLNVGSGAHGEQTAKMMTGIEEILMQEKPDALLVYGDTNSTLAGAIAASKIHIPLIHVEAGLRSFQKKMPEEVNRIMADHVSTLLFTPTVTGLNNLKNEGFDITTNHKADMDHPLVYHCGDIMFDNSLHFQKVSEAKAKVLQNAVWDLNHFALLTIHRDNNTDHPEHLKAIFTALLKVIEETDLDLVFPIHPRTKLKIEQSLDEVTKAKFKSTAKFHFIDPVGFLDMIALESKAKIVLTDSGGVQKEAYFFKKPCVIFRKETEWVEMVNNGNAILAGNDPQLIIEATQKLLNKTDFTYPDFFGDGKAAKFICEKIIENL